MLRWLLLLLVPIVNAYLFGCYYDYSQPLVLAEQLPIGVCTHVLLIGAVFVKNLDVNIVQHPYSGLNALQSMRDYRKRDSNRLKVIPSLLGDDAEWKEAMKDSESQIKFIQSLIHFVQSQVIKHFYFLIYYSNSLGY